MTTPRDPFSLDILEGADRSASPEPRRSFLQVWFRCSGQYVRVNRRKGATGYTARCPSCGKCVNFKTGPGGTDQRLFQVSCRG